MILLVFSARSDIEISSVVIHDSVVILIYFPPLHNFSFWVKCNDNIKFLHVNWILALIHVWSEAFPLNYQFILYILLWAASNWIYPITPAVYYTDVGCNRIILLCFIFIFNLLIILFPSIDSCWRKGRRERIALLWGQSLNCLYR